MFELVLWAAALPLLFIGVYRLFSYEAFQYHPEWFGHMVAPHSGARAATKNSPAETSSSPVLGRLTVPRLQISTPILEGSDEESLALAPGHLEGSAAIGSTGNAVIAGHRDFAFYGLKHIKAGDRVDVRTDKTYSYVVARTLIVKPDDVSVLKSSADGELTLITCYPFQFVGSAPERFIVQAKLVSSK